jgi:uncharacterized protein DUF928
MIVVVRTALLMAMAGTMIFSAPPFAETRSETTPGTPVAMDSGPATAGDAKPTLLAQTKKPVVYRPPLRGAPTRRVGGATRGDQVWDLVLSVLAPEETGLTARASPDLYWYLSKADSRPAVFALIRDDWVEPVVELNLGERNPGGVGKVTLADAEVRLEAGVLYEWSIALVTDAEARSKDIVSSATLMRREPSAELRRDLGGADLVGKAALYAAAGYWYDAIEALSTDPDRRTDVAELRSVRADLFEQVGLDDAAGFDRAR